MTGTLALHVEALQPMDPIELLGTLAGEADILCIQQRKGEWTIGVGCAIRITSSGPNRYGDLKRQLESLSESIDWTRAPGVPRDLAPRFMGGFQFQQGATPWSDAYPDCRLHLPAKTWILRADGTFYMEARAEMPAASTAVQLPASDTPKDRWLSGISQAIDTMRTGQLTKVVLARHCLATTTRTPVEAFLRAYALDPGNKAFLDQSAPGQAFLGVTPETLVSVRGEQVSTHALAGTIARGDDSTEDELLASELLSSSKDVLEHELVAGFLREQLVGMGVHNITQEPRRVRKQKFVQHLETLVHGTKTRDHHVLDLVQVLHPTPAVCGTPRERASEFLAAQEDFQRGWYAGAVGWVDLRGQGDFLVALRCAVLTGGVAHLFAGAGILSQSDAEAEWQETERKLLPMRNAVGA